MAMQGFKAACALAMAGSAAADLAYLQNVRGGMVSKDGLEIVLAQYNENVSWSDSYSSVRTVYCKGGAKCADGTIKLPNVGREGHTFLNHIVNNYDVLAKWTVFSQAEAPTEGYMGHNRGGGHMLSGASFEDYLEPQAAGAKFLMTSKVHLPTLQHALRSTFRTAEGQQLPPTSSHLMMCPAEDSSDAWGPYADMPWLQTFISEKCSVEKPAVGEALLSFWDDYVQLPRPYGNIVHYAQGARFAASRERIQQRSRAFYQGLLTWVAIDADPCLNYLYEWVWFYVIGTPEFSACAVSEKEACGVREAEVAPRRLGSEGAGVSGIQDHGGADAHSAVGSVLLAAMLVAAANSRCPA